MFPRVGDHVKINPEWIRLYDNEKIGLRSAFGFMKSDGLVGKVLIIESIGASGLVRVENHEVYINPDGTYMGRADDGVPFFIIAGGEKFTNILCPMCGSRGWEGFNMFHCQNPSCRNSR